MSAEGDARALRVRPRYYRLYTGPGMEPAEGNYRYHELEWTVPLATVGSVLVDVWNGHFSRHTRVTRRGFSFWQDVGFSGYRVQSPAREPAEKRQSARFPPPNRILERLQRHKALAPGILCG